MLFKCLFLTCLLVIVSLSTGIPLEDHKSSTLIIGSFNIQSLGATKIARPEFVSAVVKILAKYDIVLIQEIKDSSVGMTVTNKLLNELNLFVQ